MHCASCWRSAQQWQGAAALVFLPAFKFPVLLFVALLHAAMLAPTSVLADALALSAATASSNTRFRFEYGWVRGLGSLAFILGSLAVGQTIQAFENGSIVIGQAILLLTAAGAAFWVPEISLPRSAERSVGRAAHVGVSDLLRSPSFRWLIVVASLILGSHAIHDTFAMIPWNATGVSPVAGSVLWSEIGRCGSDFFCCCWPFSVAPYDAGDCYGSRSRRVLGALGVVGGEFQHHRYRRCCRSHCTG